MTPKIVFMAALRSRGGYYILPCGFFFYLFSSPNLSRRRLDVYHTSTHGVAIGGFWATVCNTVRPMLSVCCLSVCPVLSCLSVCDVRALWPNGWTDQDETWHAGMASALATLC